MTPELIAAIVFLAALVIIEAVYIKTGVKTISERVRDLFRLYPPVGMLAGLVVGLFLGHFFWCP